MDGGDLGLTEDEMVAQAIAMSLNNFLSQASVSEQGSSAALSSRSDRGESAPHPSQSGILVGQTGQGQAMNIDRSMLGLSCHVLR